MNKCEHAIKPHFIVGLEDVSSTGSIMTGHVPRDAIAIHVTAGIEVNWIKFQNKKTEPLLRISTRFFCMLCANVPSIVHARSFCFPAGVGLR